MESGSFINRTGPTQHSWQKENKNVSSIHMKSSSTNKTQKSRTAVVDKKMKDYGKHPFFVKKTEDANALIRKYGLPKELTKK